ncbi:hypothetical protein [Photobacterium leiognathi]|uniref:hypothetical protein n=1 Tax=Photobacterium leiognathi TaxID=553611 RepID=UPI002739666F|nr:hypothetical protein [Photobacterium leiognathi]
MAYSNNSSQFFSSNYHVTTTDRVIAILALVSMLLLTGILVTETFYLFMLMFHGMEMVSFFSIAVVTLLLPETNVFYKDSALRAILPVVLYENVTNDEMEHAYAKSVHYMMFFCALMAMFIFLTI